MTQKRILICDDQKIFIDNFILSYGSYYDIKKEDDINELLNRIDELKPDLILLDLFHQKKLDQNFEKKRLIAEKELANLFNQISQTKIAVKAAWDLQGVKVLEDIRRKHNDIPVVIFSQTGAILLDDEEIQTVVKNDGRFMLKRKDMSNIKTELDRIIETKSVLQNYKSEADRAWLILKRYKYFLIISWFIFPLIILGILTIRLQISSLGNIVIGVISSIIASIIVSFVAVYSTKILKDK